MGKERKSKGKRPKVNPKGVSPQGQVSPPPPPASSVRVLPEIAKDKQDKLAASLILLKRQPAHPAPFKTAPPAANLLLGILPKTSTKRKEHKENKSSESKGSPALTSSEETVLNGC